MEPGLVGTTHIFAAPIEACDACGTQATEATTVSNTVPVTSLLLDYVQNGSLASLEPDAFRPFLVQRLK